MLLGFRSSTGELAQRVPPGVGRMSGRSRTAPRCGRCRRPGTARRSRRGTAGRRAARAARRRAPAARGRSRRPRAGRSRPRRLALEQLAAPRSRARGATGAQAAAALRSRRRARTVPRTTMPSGIRSSTDLDDERRGRRGAVPPTPPSSLPRRTSRCTGRRRGRVVQEVGDVAAEGAHVCVEARSGQNAERSAAAAGCVGDLPTAIVAGQALFPASANPALAGAAGYGQAQVLVEEAAARRRPSTTSASGRSTTTWSRSRPFCDRLHRPLEHDLERASFWSM